MDVGTLIAGRYRLVETVGQGGMSAVYRAYDERLGRDVAVKLLHPSLATDPVFVERFRREAQSAAGLSHPNIVAVYDWGDDAGTHYLVMEYVPGSTLKEVILRRGRRPEREALEICREIAAALHEAHRHGVVHRDVKPQNVLLDTDGGVKVVDFGIAIATGESQLTRTGTILGTAHYASPEQIQRSAVDGRSDLYSLGAVLYEMLSGRPPFVADSPVAIAWQHVHEAPEPVRLHAPAIGEAAERIALKALRKDPQQRHQSAGELIEEIESALDGTPVEDAPVMPTTHAPAEAETATMALQPTLVRPKREGRDRARALRLVLAGLAALLLLPLSVLALRGLPMRNVAAPAPSVTASEAAKGVAGAVDAAPAAQPSPVPTQTTVPPPATAIPRPTAAPTAAPPSAPIVATTAPTSVPTAAPAAPAAPSTHAATSPIDAVGTFYAAAAQRRFDEAAALWSPRMRAQWPPSEFIDQRFGQTHRLTLNAARAVEQSAARAVVAVDLTEVIGNPPEARRWVGTWTLVRSGDAWLLDAPNLTRA